MGRSLGVRLSLQRIEVCKKKRSQTEQIGAEFGVPVLLCPEVEWDRGEFIHHWISQTVLREVDGLDVSVAGVAALDAYMGKLFGSVDREFHLVFLAASSTDDAAEFPFAETKPADQVAARAITLGTQDAEGRLAIAERTQRIGVTVELQARPRADEFGVRLKKSQP